jgi:hypothetical protein
MTTLDRRGRLLWVTVEAATMPLPDEPAVRALHGWLDTWRGIGDVEAGMRRYDYDLQLTRYGDEAWRATFFTSGFEHSLTSRTGSGYEKMPWRAVQMAARDALRKASA